MKILGIETSCDETAAAVVENGTHILSNVVVSQIDIFKVYGGVIPEVSARSHLEAILPVIDKALKDASCTWSDIDAIAVTHAPGLLGSLLIGTLTARTLAILHDKPLYAVHHLKSHVYANWLEGEGTSEIPFSKDISRLDRSGTYIPDAPERFVCAADGSPGVPAYDVPDGPAGPGKRYLDVPVFPLLALVISGGHTQILYMKRHNDFEIIGTTKDDAVGECFDKVAKILGLPYPGGPSIAEAAKTGDENKYKLPRPNVEGLDFSFSGLKTAVLRAVQKELNLPLNHPSHDLKNHLTKQQVADFAASFQKTAINILLEKLAKAKDQYPDAKSLVFAGGVSANRELRKKAGEGIFLSIAASPASKLQRSRFEHETANFGAEPPERCNFDHGAQRPAQENALPAFFPEPKFSGDNGAMVAAAAFYEINSGVQPTDPYKLDIYPRIAITA